MSRDPAQEAVDEIIRALWPSEHGRALISKSQKKLVTQVVTDAVKRALNSPAGATAQ